MEEGVFVLGDGTTVINNGGNPIGDCPTTWEEAYALEIKLNNGRNEDDIEGPKWDFDCGFKLDFDGPLLKVHSRFYPPKTHYGGSWDGSATVELMGKEISSRDFDCKNLDELKSQVDAYIKEFIDKIEAAIK